MKSATKTRVKKKKLGEKIEFAQAQKTSKLNEFLKSAAESFEKCFIRVKRLE